MSQQPASSQSQPWIGRLVGDRYRLEQRLGSGGMGDVFLATDTRLGKPVALKLLKDALAIATDLDLTARFERECSICAALKSVHIVQVSDYGVAAEGYPFYVMEYLQGQTLGQRLASQSRLSPEETVTIITQVCAGLNAAHSGVTVWNRETNSSEHIKVVHRDLKPDNIFLTPTALGELAKIIDFGIAKIHSLQAERTSVTSMFLGTFHYASPEQSDGGSVDERSDIYSLGVILYEMLTGIDPFGLDFRKNHVTNNVWLAAHALKPPKSLRSHPHCETISPELEAVVLRCLQKSPGDRFSSVNELRLALQAAIHATKSNGSAPSSAADPDATQYSANRVATEMRSASPNVSLNPVPFPPAANPELQSKQKSPQPRPWGMVVAALLALTAVGGYGIPRLIPTFNGLTLPLIGNSDLELAESVPSRSQTIESIRLTADGQTLISAGGDRNPSTQLYPITVQSVSNPQIQRTLESHTAVVRSLSLSANGEILVSGSDDHTIKLWNVNTGALIRTFEEHTGPVLSVALSPDGQTLISGSEDRTVRVWNLQTGEGQVLQAHSNAVYSVALSPDGQLIASSGADKTIRLWDRTTGELLRTLGEPGGHRDVISSVAFSPDGRQLISGSWDKFVKLWDATTGQLLHTLEGHSDRVTAVVFTSANAIASASFDHTIRIWDGETGRSQQILSDHSSRVLALSSTTNRSLASSSRDGTIKIWQ